MFVFLLNRNITKEIFMRFIGISVIIVLTTHLYGVDVGLQKLCEQLITYHARSANDSWARQNLSDQKPDGSWADIAYASQSNSGWEPSKHLDRLYQITRCYAASKSAFYQKPEVLSSIVRGLDFWVVHDPRSSNWWWQAIGTPRQLCIILLMLRADLPPEYLKKFRPFFDRSKPGMTGQNKIWLAQIHLQKGLLYNLPVQVREGRDLLAEELRIAISGSEGIQSDWSFHQHGPQLQFGNYGLAYFAEMVGWCFILAGTDYAFPPEKVEILENYYRNGLRWVLFDGLMDLNACGRSYDWRSQFRRYDSAIGAAGQLYRILGQKKAIKDELHFSGSRYFYNSDFYVQRFSEVYFSVRMCSARTIGSETINRENLLGRLSAHGVTMLMTGPEEVKELGALWNWRQLPGVTSVQNDSSLECKGPNLRNKCEWVGGLSDTEVGFCAMDFDNGELTAKKSYFFFHNSMVCVGSHIACRIKAPVVTSIAQHRISEETLKWNLERDQVTCGSFSWKIISAPNSTLRAGVREVAGDWKKVSQRFSTKAVTGKIFFVSLDHGQCPKAGSYAYSVSYKGGKQDHILLPGSSDAIHAVAKDGIVMVVFYEPGSIILPDGIELTAKQPVLLMLRNDKLYAADPSQKRKIFDVKIGNRQYRISLPQGQKAGDTVAIEL